MAKRDDDFMRELLLEFEQSTDDLFLIGGVAGMSPEERKREYHVKLACDAGLMVQTNPTAYRLTNAGHDYLASVRDEGIWKRTKEAVSETGGSASIELLKAVALGFVRKQINDRTGLDL